MQLFWNLVSNCNVGQEQAKDLVDENPTVAGVPASGVDPQCTLQTSFVCQPGGPGALQTLRDTSKAECEAACNRQENCSFITFTQFRGRSACHLLTSCPTKVSHARPEYKPAPLQLPPCSAPDICASSSCRPVGMAGECAQLKPGPASSAVWRCEGGNPYKAETRAGSLCHAT